MCIDVLLVRVSVHQDMPGTDKGLEKVLDPPELQLQMIVRCFVFTGNRTLTTEPSP